MAETIALTLTVIAATTIASLVIGTICALIIRFTTFPGKKIIATILPLSLTIPSYIMAFVMLPIFDDMRLAGAIAVLSMITTPYVFLQVYAALTHYSPELLDLSKTLGKNRWQQFRHGIFPYIQDALISSALLISLYVLSDFGAVSLFNIRTLTYELFNALTLSFDQTEAQRIAVIISAFAALPLIAAIFRKKHTVYQSRTMTQEKENKIGGLFCALFCTCAFLLPLLQIGYWLTQTTTMPVKLPLLQSVSLAFGVSSICAIVALATAIIGHHYKKFDAIVRTIAGITFGLPGIVIAFILVTGSLQFSENLYQTFTLLIIGYIFHFFFISYNFARDNLRNIPQSMIENAKTLGSTTSTIVARIMLPLMMPSLIAGFALTFMHVIKELPITLILAPLETQTLATTTWLLAEDALFAEAAIPSLFLVLIAIIAWRIALHLIARQNTSS